MHTCVHTHTQTHKYTNAYTHKYIHTHTHTYLRISQVVERLRMESQCRTLQLDISKNTIKTSKQIRYKNKA